MSFLIMNKDDEINIKNHSHLNKKRITVNFSLCMKMSEETTYFKRNKKTILDPENII